MLSALLNLGIRKWQMQTSFHSQIHTCEGSVFFFNGMKTAMVAHRAIWEILKEWHIDFGVDSCADNQLAELIKLSEQYGDNGELEYEVSWLAETARLHFPW